MNKGLRTMVMIGALLALGGCAGLSVSGAPTDAATQTDVSAANATMQVAQVVARVGSVDCTQPAPAVVCTPGAIGDTKGTVQAKTQECLTGIAVAGLVNAVQTRLCGGVIRTPVVVPK